MTIPAPVQSFWRAFAASCRSDPTPRFIEAFHFAHDADTADALLALVLAGRKRATASLLWRYQHDRRPPPQAGDLSVVTDSAGSPRCVIETTGTELVPFDQVTAGFAAAEGEGDGSLVYWRRAHEAFFDEECRLLGRSPSPTMPVLCEHFEVIFEADAAGRRTSPLPRCGDGALLRRLSRRDLEAFQRYRTDPGVARHQGWSAMDDRQALDFLAAVNRMPLLLRGEWTQIALCEAGHAALAGDIGLLIADDGSEAEIGFTLAPSYQGRGLATAAVRLAIGLLVEATPVRSIKAVTDERNRPSIRLLERLALQRVGRVETEFRGERCVELTYRLERPDAA